MTDYWSRPGSSGEPDFEITLDGGDWSGSVRAVTGAPRHDGEGPPSGRNWGAIVGLGGARRDRARDRRQRRRSRSPATTLRDRRPGEHDDGTGTAGGRADRSARRRSGTLEVGALGDVRHARDPLPADGERPDADPAADPGLPDRAGLGRRGPERLRPRRGGRPTTCPAPTRSARCSTSSAPNLIGSATTGGTPLPPLRATASSEPASARDALTIEYGGERVALVVDRARAGRVHARPQRTTASGTRSNRRTLLDGTGTDSLDALFDAFVTGPITPAALEHATITPSPGLMRIMGGGYARRFDVEVPIEYLRPYGALLFAERHGRHASTPTRCPTTITFQVYVTARQPVWRW